ncbi:MAG: radical SAM protein [Anaerohalosphaeraceae bacterium]|nr:radical SAM protein [Anaerohalosphaeraceae bacterium]
MHIQDLQEPELVEIEPVHNCNLRCLMCHVRDEKLTNTKLDISCFRHLNGIEGKWVLLGSGYEPFMHPDIVKIIQRLSELGANIDLTTNGTLLNPKTVSAITGANFKNVSFSVDGVSRKTYETIRLNACFDSTIENIANFRQQMKDCYCAINYTVSKINLNEVSDAVDFFEEKGFNHLGFISMVVRSESGDVKKLSTEKDLAEYVRQLDEAAQKIINGKYRITISSPLFLHNDYLSEKYKANLLDTTLKSNNEYAKVPFNPRNSFQTGSFAGMKIDCRSPFVFARILYDGTVLLCNKFDIGSIYQDSLRDIWYSGRANFVRRLIMENPRICKSCDYYRFCLRADELDYTKKETHYAENISGNDNPILIEGYKDYNIVLWQNKYYSIHRALGSIGIEMFLAEFNKVEGVVVASTIEESRKAIDEMIAKSTYPQPILVNTHKRHNIISFVDKYFAIPQSLGKIEVAQMGYHASIIKCDSINGLKELVDNKIKR